MGSIAAVELLLNLEMADKLLTLEMNSWVGEAWHSFWQFITAKQTWYPLYVVVLIFFYIRLGWKKATIVTISCILTIVACDQFSNFTKEFFARYRPCWDEFMIENGLNILEGKGNYFGFFSAHAANHMGFAVSSFMGFRNDRRLSYKWYGYPILFWAVLVGLSRIFVGKHYFGDVVVGLAVGALFAWLISSLARLAIRKFKL